MSVTIGSIASGPLVPAVIPTARIHASADFSQTSVPFEPFRPQLAPLPVPPQIERLRTEAVFTYDAERAHPLRELIAAVLECDDVRELPALHAQPRIVAQQAHAPPLCPTLMHAARLHGVKLPGKWTHLMGPGRQRKVLTRLWTSSAYIKWLEGFDAVSADQVSLKTVVSAVSMEEEVEAR